MKKEQLIRRLKKALEPYDSDEVAAGIIGVERSTIWRWRHGFIGERGKAYRAIIRAIRLLEVHTKAEVNPRLREQRVVELKQIHSGLSLLEKRVARLISTYKISPKK